MHRMSPLRPPAIYAQTHKKGEKTVNRTLIAAGVAALAAITFAPLAHAGPAPGAQLL